MRLVIHCNGTFLQKLSVRPWPFVCFSQDSRIFISAFLFAYFLLAEFSTAKHRLRAHARGDGKWQGHWHWHMREGIGEGIGSIRWDNSGKFPQKRTKESHHKHKECDGPKRETSSVWSYRYSWSMVVIGVHFQKWIVPGQRTTFTLNIRSLFSLSFFLSLSRVIITDQRPMPSHTDTLAIHY